MSSNIETIFPGLVPVRKEGLYIVTKRELFNVPVDCIGLVGFTKYQHPTTKEIANELTQIAQLLYHENGTKENYFSQLEQKGAETEQVIETIKEYPPEFQECLANGLDWVVRNILQNAHLFTSQNSLVAEAEYLRAEHFHLYKEDVPLSQGSLTARIKSMTLEEIQETTIDIWHADVYNKFKEPLLSQEQLRERIVVEEVHQSKAIRVGNLSSHYPKEELCFLLPTIYQKISTGMQNIFNDSPSHLYEILWDTLQFQAEELQDGLKEYIIKEEESKKSVSQPNGHRVFQVIKGGKD